MTLGHHPNDAPEEVVITSSIKIAAKLEPYFGDQHDINMLDVPSGYLT